MKKLVLIRMFEPFSVFKIFLFLGFVGGLWYGFILGLALVSTGKISGGIAIPMGIAISIMFGVAIKSVAQAFLYNFFSGFLKGVNLTFIETDRGLQIQSFNLWSLIRLFVPLLVITMAFCGLAIGTIMKLANLYELEFPMFMYMPDVVGSVLIMALIGLIIAVSIVISGAIYNLLAHILCTGFRFQLSEPINNKRTLQNIDANSIFKLSLAIGIVWGIIVALLLPIFLPLTEILNFIKQLSLSDFIRIGIVGGIIWAFTAGIKAIFYNLAAKLFKGIEIEMIFKEG